MEHFKSEIGLDLESKLKTVFGFTEIPYGTAFDSDMIEAGFLYDALCLILCKKEISDWGKFSDSFLKYKGMSGADIGMTQAKVMYNNFLALIGEN